MRFEIFRLDEAGVATDTLIAEADAVRSIVDHAAATGERLYIRPVPNTTS
ncbi:hypothetical protein [Streptacidiphilus jiangxiensis]|uniref:Uncharacterized protein n=1 Tax=Streptacidiphilus jiangxiensis TaxID=235985 RepID=A0A1H7G128_STRJI|nr:hypothetical protein [Streptacidiphilus jiangxiensis]SEK29395.1 hypothetical protein SAMN05414137_101401 [Streptacidiphilus jiangxiensis]